MNNYQELNVDALENVSGGKSSRPRFFVTGPRYDLIVHKIVVKLLKKRK